MRELTALLFISTDLQKGGGGSLSNTKRQSTNPVQKPTANEDWEPESIDQHWSLLGEGGSLHIPPRCVLKARGRETF